MHVRTAVEVSAARSRDCHSASVRSASTSHMALVQNKDAIVFGRTRRLRCKCWHASNPSPWDRGVMMLSAWALCEPRILIQCCRKMSPSSSGRNFSFETLCEESVSKLLLRIGSVRIFHFIGRVQTLCQTHCDWLLSILIFCSHNVCVTNITFQTASKHGRCEAAATPRGVG